MSETDENEHNLNRSVQYLRGVGPAKAKVLQKLGISTVADLLTFYPSRYEDRRRLVAPGELLAGTVGTVWGVVATTQERRPRKNMLITRIGIVNGGELVWGIFFNRPYIARELPIGASLLLTGKVERFGGETRLLHPEHELLDGDDPIHSGRIVPIYPLTAGLTSRVMRRLIHEVLPKYATGFRELLPADLRQKYGLLEKAAAVSEIHFPCSQDSLGLARKRLVFEELFYLQLGLARRRAQRQAEAGVEHLPDGPLLADFRRGLPFTFTSGQTKTWTEIREDMERQCPMNRLLHGEVGTGKTVVAAAALVKAAEGGYQGVMLAPTEVLAEQHAWNLSRLFSPIGLKVGLLTAAARDRQGILADLEQGDLKVVVGTQALFSREVSFEKLGLVIIDEQHRFGVEQRKAILGKGGTIHPDLLVMSATPIPRTLALTLYGDLDVSVITEGPKGRQKPQTFLLEATHRGKAYAILDAEVTKGRQAFVVCPLIEDPTGQAVAVNKLAGLLQNQFPRWRVGLVHGRMKSTEKEETFAAFHRGEIQVLVTTTVVEVGVDVANATVMLIEGAERFGLAQLHQLRGRVGRGGHPSFCLLVGKTKGTEGKRRLEVMVQLQDGLAIAEEDLKLRGPGEFFGTRQHGLPDLKITDPLRDLEILEIARLEARAVLSRGERGILDRVEAMEIIS